MMKNREFRELQVSSTQLAIIFLAILILGVIIFLLGVSVGKKHAQVAKTSDLIAKKEPVAEPEKIVLPQVKPQAKETAASPKAEEVPAQKAVIPEKPRPEPKTEPAAARPQFPAAKGGRYYVQVGALEDRQAAQSAAQTFKSQGYQVIVLDPQPSDKKPLFRVRVGGFSTKEEAEAVKAKLTAAAGKKTDYFIVRD
ncbi:MAG: SPOR domain-containing protein [Clostridiales bacterium]|nr:SPOR domain-containing protein [Clostridiales bacterium]